jgi:hypothetical protein
MSELNPIGPIAPIGAAAAVAGAASIRARDVQAHDDRDYELDLHVYERDEEVAEAERVASTDGERRQPEDERPRGDRRAPNPEDDDDDEPHLLDVTA